VAARLLWTPKTREVVATILTSPNQHIGKIYHLTGPASLNMGELAAEYSKALGRPIKYIDMPYDEWKALELQPRNLPSHIRDHIATMTHLHAENKYDRLTKDVEAIIGRPARSLRSFVEKHAKEFGATVDSHQA